MLKVKLVLIMAGLMFSIAGGFYLKGFNIGFDAGQSVYDQQAFDAEFKFPVKHVHHAKAKHHTVWEAVDNE